MPTRAVLFRFDGVLADTANVRIAAWQRTFRALGWVESDETCARGITLEDEAFAAEVFARRKVEEGDPAGWSERQQGLALQLLRDRPLLMPRIPDLVHALSDQGIALAIISPAPDDQITTVLAASGLLDSFDARVTGPDARAEGAELVALRELEIEPGDAVTLVATLAERNSARRSGLHAVVVAPSRPADVDASAWLADFNDPAANRAALGF